MQRGSTSSPAQTGSAVHRRRAGDQHALPSSDFGRLCLVLLVAPWVLILTLRNVFAVDAINSSTFLFVLILELAIVTIASLTLVSGRLRELKRYEAQREHERLLFSYARDGMLLVRVAGSRRKPQDLRFVIQAENPTAIEHLSSFGQSGSYVGCDIEQVFPDWLRKKIRSEYTACVLSGEVQRYEVCHPDRKLAHESIATPVIDPVRKCVTHIIVIMRDIGERITHERELNLALSRAEAANKSKSEFLASMSHELRTPLNAVLGFSEALTSGIGGPLSPRQAEYLGHIHQSGSHLLSIISDILDLSKIEAGHIVLQERPVDLAPLIETCILMVRERAYAKKLTILIELAPGLPRLQVDPLRLKQILINLLSNAIKFTDAGAVTLSVAFHPESGFEFSVADTGIGMTAEEMKLAVQPFGQVEGAFSRNHEGTGLGLPIARHLATLHGGTLVISSSPKRGTCVTVSLPPGKAIADRAVAGLAVAG